MFSSDIKDFEFIKYNYFYANFEATVTDTRKLWKNVEPHLKKALQTVYLREVSRLGTLLFVFLFLKKSQF